MPKPEDSVPPVRARLRELLAENRTRDPEFAQGLSSHQSMALAALASLGADDARLTTFAEAYGARLRPLRAEVPGAGSDVGASLGVPAALVGLIRGFEQDIAERGRSAVLRGVLPRLLPGLAGAAFHGLIRTAYALEAEDDSELAHALAYFVTVAKPLRPLPPPQQSAAAAEVLRAARDDPRLRRGFSGSLITDAMRAAVDQPALDEHVSALRVDSTTLDALAHGALYFYVTTADFTALHAVTATHALRLLLPYLADADVDGALRYHFQALLAAWCSVAPKPAPPRPSTERDVPTFDELAAIAVQRDDDHDVKLVFTCREEAKVRDWEEYRVAAALRLGVG